MLESPFGIRERILENDLAYAIFDAFPVVTGHALVVPKRVFQSYFEASEAERTALWNLVAELSTLLSDRFRPDGFNIGINVGAAAGQTVAHMHIHVIPRKQGDVPDPRGGVRAIIPGKALYEGL